MDQIGEERLGRRRRSAPGACDRIGERIEQNAIYRQRDAEADEPIHKEPGQAFAVVRSWSEIARYQEKEAHEIGLIGGDKENKENSGERNGSRQFAVIPSPGRAVGYGRVMKDDEGGEDHSYAVDVVFAQVSGAGLTASRCCRRNRIRRSHSRYLRIGRDSRSLNSRAGATTV